MIKAGNPNNYKSCSDCGITHTPLWRGGPLGPKTMCNACGIRWKRANQSGKNKQHHEKISKAEYHSEDEKIEYDSAEELLALSDPESNTARHSPRDSADSNESTKRRSKSMKKKPLHSARNSKPYSRTPLNNRELENEAEDSMLILQQAAEEFDRLGDVPADDSANEPSSTGSSLNGSANTSPTPIDMTNSTIKQEDVKNKMDQLFSEVMALREEVQKRDAIIDMFKHSNATSYSSSSSLVGRSHQELPPVIAH